MGLTHIVMFQFKADAAADAVNAFCTRMLSLKTSCIHPSTQQPYIKSVSGGKDNSPESFQVRKLRRWTDANPQNGLTHAFVLDFDTREHRDYYMKEEPAHLNLARDAKEIIKKVVVLDFTPGEFGPKLL